MQEGHVAYHIELMCAVGQRGNAFTDILSTQSQVPPSILRQWGLGVNTDVRVPMDCLSHIVALSLINSVSITLSGVFSCLPWLPGNANSGSTSGSGVGPTRWRKFCARDRT